MIQPESLRAPEVIIGAEWDTKADIWNLGCLVGATHLRRQLFWQGLSDLRTKKIYEFSRGTKLFDPHWDNAQSGMGPEQTHLAQISGLCGEFPAALLSEGTRSRRYFDEQGSFRFLFCYVLGSIAYLS